MAADVPTYAGTNKTEEDEACAGVPGVPDAVLKPTSLHANGEETRAGATLVALEPSPVVPLDDVNSNDEPKKTWPAAEDAAVVVEPTPLPDEWI